jgi:regulator of protease activity HflC (stomatin/prohibitin superfamily)
MSIKKIITIGALLLGCLSMASCSKVPAGQVGVKVYLLGDSKGVDNQILGPGRYFIGWNEDLFLFPTFTQNYTWDNIKDSSSPEDESITFQDRDGLKVNSDIGIAYSFDPSKISNIFQRYRKGTEELNQIVIRNAVRDALVSEASKMRVDEIYGPGKEQLIKNVEARVRSQFDPIGIKVERLYWTGAFRLPDEVVNMINAKINASQKTLQKTQEVESAKADAQKAIEDARGRAESVLLEAEAQAKANKILSESITPELVKYKAIERWDGKMPKVQGTSNGMLLNSDDLLKENDSLKK